jgi:hypothetical protein
MLASPGDIMPTRKFLSSTPIEEVIDYCASRSKIWSTYLNDQGCACTLGELGKAALGLKTLKQDEWIVGEMFSDSNSEKKKARWERIIDLTSGPANPAVREYYEDDQLPKGFVPYQKRPRTVRAIKTFLRKETPTFGEFRKKLRDRLNQKKLNEARSAYNGW